MTTGPSEPPADVHCALNGAADVAVIGAGPAGLAAAVAAADGGASVVLIDAEPGPGGQFWRHPAPVDGAAAGADGDAGHDAAPSDADVAYLHHDLRTYRRLRARWEAHVARGLGAYRPSTEVWAAERTPDGARIALHLTGGAGHRESLVRAVILATGAYDLQVPFEGWDLPGVMTAGGVQSLLKGHAVLAGRRVAVAGTGPFLLSVAAGLARSGADVVGVFDAAPVRRWAGLAAAGATQPGKLREAAGYGLDFARHRVRLRSGWTVLRAQSDSDGRNLAGVTVAPIGPGGDIDETRSRVIDVDVLAVGWGFVPRLELAVALGCRTEPDATGLPVAVADAAQRATVRGVYLAGEIGGVGGAALALAEGEIAGTVAAAELDGQPSAQRRHALRRALAGPQRRRARMRRFAAALGRSFPVPDAWRTALPPETVVCRCEEVTAAQILTAARRYGAGDARTMKLLARTGMGWCQGRICGYATEELVAHHAGAAPVHRPAGIPVAFPVPLGDLGGALPR